MPYGSLDPESFLAGAAKTFWADAYMTEVEENGAEKKLGPGAGGDWMDVLPPVPESAIADAKRFAAKVVEKLTVEQAQEIVDKLPDAESAGHYAAMQAMGHGVGLGDYGVDVKLPHWEQSVAVRNDAYDAVQEAL